MARVFQALKRQDVLKLPWPALKNPPKPMTAPCRFVFSLVSGKGWWKEMVGYAVFGGHPTSIQVFVNKTWKINMTPSNDMPDLEDYLLAIWFVLFPAAWQWGFFLAMKILRLPTDMIFKMFFTFTSNPISRVSLLCHEGCFRDTIFGSQ